MKKNSSDGFTLMETLVSIAIILILSGCIIAAFSAGMKANIKSLSSVRSARLLLDTDRFIRTQADSLHVPYWLNPDESIESFRNQLQRSRVGKYIHKITVIYDGYGSPRGIEAEYNIGMTTAKTSALFPFQQVKDGKK